MPTNQPLSLSELIKTVADELRLANENSKEKTPVMKFTECELELKVNVAVEGKAGIKFWIVDIGGGGKKENAHTIKVKFNSLDGSNLAFSATKTKPAKPIKPNY
ncbi:MAG: trypco2 family protein [Ferruginibacter sp.]